VKCDINVKERENYFLPELAVSVKAVLLLISVFFLPAVTMKRKGWGRVDGRHNSPFALTYFSWIPIHIKSKGGFFLSD
jgi:hypothetical protein